jgi:hypothetical protein
MLRSFAILLLLLATACTENTATNDLSVKKILPKELKEISGMVVSGDNIWTITDKPKPVLYNLDSNGNLVQTITINNVQVVDVEAVTADDKFVYLGDLGDNDGNREGRQIIKIAVDSIGKGATASANGEVISFDFPGDVEKDKKKKNNYDCEALLSYHDSLYVFTKERDSLRTKLFALPKTPGTYTARFLDSFDTKGLVTDAAINQSNNEVALIGYKQGHKYPFIIVFKNFQGEDFFTGKPEKIELADKPWDWQLESITYKRDDKVFFSCEGTKEVDATFYGIERNKLKKLDKKKKDNDKKDKDDDKGITTKGKLKYN